MVWSQYVYEANVDNLDGGYPSETDDVYDEIPMTINDWEMEYSDELWYMWDTIRTLLHDAHITHTGKFCDFVEFCYTEHDPYHERVLWEYEEQTCWYEDRLAHIWRNIRRIRNECGLYEHMLKTTTLYHFIDFAKKNMNIQ